MKLPGEIERQIRADSIRKGVNVAIVIFLIFTWWYFWGPVTVKLFWDGVVLIWEFFQ